MINDVDRLGARRQGFSPEFVIGVILSGQAKAYYYADAEAAGAINDVLGDVPIVVWAAGETFHVYISEKPVGVC